MENVSRKLFKAESVQVMGWGAPSGPIEPTCISVVCGTHLRVLRLLRQWDLGAAQIISSRFSQRSPIGVRP